MTGYKKYNQDKLNDIVIDQALKHVEYDGWSDQTLKKVCQELKLSEEKIYQMFPRGGVDLALAFHERDDERFLINFSILESNQTNQRVRDRVESAINCRLDTAAQNREAVKRSLALLTTPFYLSQGTRAVWDTCDRIWIAVGDESVDLNWYSKRIILSSVYTAVLLFWVEDDSKNFSQTKEFISRRINNVMDLDRFKRGMEKSNLWKGFKRKFEVS